MGLNRIPSTEPPRQSKILLIDDDASIRLGFMDLLQRHNFRTFEAEDGTRGVRIAKEEVPDLIICDISMPKLDGFGVLDELQKDPRTVSIPIIFLSGKSERTDQRMGMELGAYDYLTKPCSGDELLRAVAASLAKHRAVAGRYITELKKAEQEVDYLVHHDPLTGLFNLRSLRLEFNRQLGRPDRSSSIGLLIVKPDRYQRFLELLGPVRSEDLWKSVARKMTSHLSEELIAARLSQGELAVILPETTEKEALSKAIDIRISLAGSYTVESQEVYLTFSSGVSLAPDHGTEIDELLQNAYLALETAASGGGSGCSVYQESLRQSDSSLMLESRLRRALEKKELSLSYQPQIDLATGQVVGAEALIRWKDPDRGVISPGVFIPIAEESGLILEIGEWVTNTACRQAVDWQNKFGRKLRMAVNLSGKQFHDPDLVAVISRAVRESGIDPNSLEVEVVESTIMEDTTKAALKLDALQSLGIKVALDDFGTGYSSLSYLRRFQFDVLKMDRSFVRDIGKDTRTAAIGEAIIKLAHSLGARVIAEGVETPDELTFLKTESCDEAQGFLISAPLTAEDFAEFLQTYSS